MSNDRSDQKGQPLHVWLPTFVLKFLVFLAFACYGGHISNRCLYPIFTSLKDVDDAPCGKRAQARARLRYIDPVSLGRP